MSRRVKCKYCGELGTSDTFYKLTENNKNKYFCNEYEADQYLQAELKRKEQNELRSDALTFIHDEVYELQEGELLEKYIVKRTNELSSFYPWQVIKGCFKMKRKTIQYILRNKDFKNGYYQSKYILAIIESVINDVNKAWNKKLQKESRMKRMDEDIIDVDTYELSTKINVKNNNENKGIADFLEEDEL